MPNETKTLESLEIRSVSKPLFFLGQMQDTIQALGAWAAGVNSLLSRALCPT